jgi:hypothetical protein
MADFSSHLAQVKSNLDFLKKINTHCNEYIDWQVTTCFYVGVHVINAFLANEANVHFGSHERVKDAISPNSPITATRLDESTYLAYVKLRNLSRRSRYLCSDERPDKEVERTFKIYEQHYRKSFSQLDKLMSFFYRKYGTELPVTNIKYNFTSALPNCHYFKFNAV